LIFPSEERIYISESRWASNCCIRRKGRPNCAKLDKELRNIDTSITELSGQTAYPGKITGRARRAMLAKDSHELITGEILVCPATSPEYVPAMKRHRLL